MTLRRLLSAAPWAVGLIIGFALAYSWTALAEAVECYALHWSNPNSDMNPNAVNWQECTRHLSWPFSFFSSEQ